MHVILTKHTITQIIIREIVSRNIKKLQVLSKWVYETMRHTRRSPELNLFCASWQGSNQSLST